MSTELVPPVQLWFTRHEWESLRSEDVAAVPPVAVALAVLAGPEAALDVSVRTDSPVVQVGARVAVQGELGVQLAAVRTERVEGVRLVLFPVADLAAKLADLVPAAERDGSGDSDEAGDGVRTAAEYPYKLFVAGLEAAARGPAVLREVCAELDADWPQPHGDGPDPAGGGTSLRSNRDTAARMAELADCRGRLDAVFVSGEGALPAATWVLGRSGWFAFDPARQDGRALMRVRPVMPADLAAAVAPALAASLDSALGAARCGQLRPSGRDRPPAR